MSRFQVVPVAAADASQRLATIPGGVQEAHGRLGSWSNAGAGTPASGALEELMSRWGEALPRFAASAGSLSGAVAAAGRAYTAADDGVARAAS